MRGVGELRIELNVHVRCVILEGNEGDGPRDRAIFCRVETLHCKRIMLCGRDHHAGSASSFRVTRERVERIGVTLVRDLPSVGARVLDHHGAAIFFLPSLGVVALDDPLIQTLYRYTSDGSLHLNDMQIQAGSSCFRFRGSAIPIVLMVCR